MGQEGGDSREAVGSVVSNSEGKCCPCVSEGVELCFCVCVRMCVCMHESRHLPARLLGLFEALAWGSEEWALG